MLEVYGQQETTARGLFLEEQYKGVPQVIDNARELYDIAREVRTDRELLEYRQRFGPGNAGTESFILAATASLCELKDFDSNGKPIICINPCVGTFDFDILGELEFLPHCSDHEEAAYTKLEKTLDPIRFAGLGQNGWGRA